MRRAATLAFCTCAMAILLPAAARAAWTSDQQALFDTLNEEYTYFSDSVGSVAAVAQGQVDAPWVGVKGLADIDTKTPLAADDLFRIGSITKTFVAVSVLQMVEEGKVALADPLSTWYPAYPRSEKITIRMLLSHTSGIPDYLESTQVDPAKTYTPDEIIGLTLTMPPYFEPGADWAYSNTDYIFLGAIAEKLESKKIARSSVPASSTSSVSPRRFSTARRRSPGRSPRDTSTLTEP